MISSYYSITLYGDTPQKENEITVRTKLIVLIFHWGQVCIASRGKEKKYCMEVYFGENADSADVFGRALGFRGTVFP